MPDSDLATIYPDFDALPPGQQRILEAALVLFSERGYASTSTSAIAKTAGVAEGLIFKHFNNKQKLFLKLVQPLVVQIFFPQTLKRLRAILSQDFASLESLLEAILRERLAFVKSHHKLLRVVIQEIWHQDALRTQLIQRFEEIIQPYFQAQLDHFQAQGAIRAMPFYTFLRLLMSAFMGLIIPRVLLFPHSDWDEEAEIQQTIQTLVQGLRPAEKETS